MRSVSGNLKRAAGAIRSHCGEVSGGDGHAVGRHRRQSGNVG